jgi:WD40 repeat protein
MFTLAAGKKKLGVTLKPRVRPCADSFFGKPELQQQVIEVNQPTRCAAGVLALRVPDPPAYAPPSVCAISKDGKIAAVGGKDVELFLWNTETGDLLSTLRGHEIAWTTSNDNTFFVTVQEDSKVRSPRLDCQRVCLDIFNNPSIWVSVGRWPRFCFHRCSSGIKSSCGSVSC